MHILAASRLSYKIPNSLRTYQPALSMPESPLFPAPSASCLWGQGLWEAALLAVEEEWRQIWSPVSWGWSTFPWGDSYRHECCQPSMDFLSASLCNWFVSSSDLRFPRGISFHDPSHDYVESLGQSSLNQDLINPELFTTQMSLDTLINSFPLDWNTHFGGASPLPFFFFFFWFWPFPKWLAC